MTENEAERADRIDEHNRLNALVELFDVARTVLWEWGNGSIRTIGMAVADLDRAMKRFPATSDETDTNKDQQ